MPTLCMFFGIIVRMFAEINGKHNTPHIHAKYNDNEVVMDFEGNVLEGSLPSKQLKMLSMHDDELKANWELLSNGEHFFKIDPLK